MSTKSEAAIQAEIRDILKQIVSTVTFLPTMDEPTVFNILAYTSTSADVPADEWVDTDPLAIEANKSQQVKLRSFAQEQLQLSILSERSLRCPYMVHYRLHTRRHPPRSCTMSTLKLKYIDHSATLCHRA